MHLRVPVVPPLNRIPTYSYLLAGGPGHPLVILMLCVCTLQARSCRWL
jgi:hypothetical protein